jgi:hypothetical protein
MRLILTLLCALAVPATAKEDPALAKTVSGKTVAGLQWFLNMPRQFTDHDALFVTCTLSNVSAEKITISSIVPKIDFVLTGQNKKPVRREMKDLRLQSATPQKGGSVFRFSTDLRRQFGRLEPGRYTFRLVLPGSHYKLKGAQDAGDIPSADMTFDVVKTTLADAKQAAKATPDVKIEFIAGKGKAPTLCKVTNTGNRSIVIMAYVGGPKDQPLTCISFVHEKWTGKGFLQHSMGGWCGTGLGDIQIKPGESRKLRINSYTEGIGRFKLAYTANGKNRTAYSDAFLIDTFNG